MTYVLDASSQTSWRQQPTSVGFYCFIHEPEVVFKARMNMPAGIVYPNQLFLYDGVTVGAFTDLEEDMLLLLGSADGLDDLGRVRLRKNANTGDVATATTIYIQRSSQGVLDGEIEITDNAYITVLDAFWLWSVPPLIDENGVIYEDSESGFTEAKHLLPVAPAGVDFLIVLENIGDDVTLDFGENPAYATAEGETIVATDWTFPDGQTSSSAAPTMTFEADTVGYYSLTVEDSLGNIVTSRRFMAVVNQDHANLIKNFEITQHVARVDGQEMTIIPHQELPYTQYPDGTEVLIAMRERRGSTVGGLVGSPGFEDMIFAGFLGQESMSGEAGLNGYLDNTPIVLLDTAGKLKTLPGFTEEKEREDTPTSWSHMKGANIDRYVATILGHRSNALRRLDFVWSGTGEDYAFTVLGSDGGNLYDQADLRCQAIAHKLTVDRYGRHIMRPDPQLQAEADKTTDVIVPIAETDWSQLRRVWNRSPRTHWNWGEAIAVSTANASDTPTIATFFNVAPGRAPGMGLSAQTSGEQLAISQDELNVRERHRYEARLNNLFGNIEVLLARDGYFCDPSLMKWAQLEITSSAAGVRGRSWVSTTRFLPLEMNYRYDHFNGTREQRITLEKEVVTNRVAVTYVPPGGSGFVDPGSPTYAQPSILPMVGSNLLYGGNPDIGLLTASGITHSNGTFLSASPTWVSESWLDGSALDFFDASEVIRCGVQKPHFARTLHIATTTKARVLTNVLDGTTLGLTYALRATGTWRRVQTERGDPNICYIVTAYTDGIWSEGHINGAAITAVRIGANFNAASFQQQPNILVDADNPLIAYVVSYDGSIYRWYKTTDGGVSWNTNSDYEWTPTNIPYTPTLERPLLDTSKMYAGKWLNSGGSPDDDLEALYVMTSGSTTQLRTDGCLNRRGLRPLDSDPLTFFHARWMFGTGGNYLFGIQKTHDGGSIWLTIKSDTTPHNAEVGAQLGGDGAVYLWSAAQLRFHPNIYTLTTETDFQDKTGSGYPAGATFVPHNLMGL